MKKIMIACSTKFYSKIDSIKDVLISKGYEIIYPNFYNEKYSYNDNMSEEEYNEFFKKCFISSKEKIESTDELLVLNYSKNDISNYIGASTFLEMYLAYMQGKKVYLINGLPDKDFMLYDEIKGFKPILLCGNINNIDKENENGR